MRVQWIPLPPAVGYRFEAMHEKKYPLVCDIRDPRFTALRSLQTPHGRSRSGTYLIEGIRHVAKAIENQAPIESVFFDPSTLSNFFGCKLAAQLRRKGVPGLRLAPALYRQLTLAAEPQGIGAVVRKDPHSIMNLAARRDSVWLAIESIESAGNVGTIVRTAEATGMAGIFLVDPHTDPWDPAAVRASMGSLFSQTLARCSRSELRSWARSHNVAIVGSSPSGLVSYKEMQWRRPFVLAIGSERKGMSEQLSETCDFIVRIPMSGTCDSINVAVAAGVLLFEACAQRSELNTRGRVP